MIDMKTQPDGSIQVTFQNISKAEVMRNPAEYAITFYTRAIRPDQTVDTYAVQLDFQDLPDLLLDLLRMAEEEDFVGLTDRLIAEEEDEAKKRIDLPRFVLALLDAASAEEKAEVIRQANTEERRRSFYGDNDEEHAGT